MLNQVTIVGTVSKEPEYLFTTKSGNNKYRFFVDCERNSGAIDSIPVVGYSDELKTGDRVKVEGIYTSFNQINGDKTKLKLAVKANKIEPLVLPLDDQNEIEMEGIICKKPILRETPFGRTISDVIVAVNRDAYNYSDYIPLIFWGYCANQVSKFIVGDCIKIKGRIQSRPYTKEDVEYTAYEVSASSLEILGNNRK